MNEISIEKLNNDVAPFVLISGASANELNYEYKGTGSLSYAFSKAMTKLGSHFSYNQLFSKIEAEMNIISPRQNPTIEGDLNWNNSVNVPVSTTFSFTGAGNFNWTGGNLNGGGVLTNQSTIRLTAIYDKAIQDNTTLSNEGAINITSSGNMAIQSGSVVDNHSAGVIDLQADNGNITASGNSNGLSSYKKAFLATNSFVKIESVISFK